MPSVFSSIPSPHQVQSDGEREKIQLESPPASVGTSSTEKP